MTVTIEDGSIVSGADSYATRAEYIAFALARGYIVADDTEADNELVKAFDYIRSLEASLIGNLVDETQTGAYPRYNLVINGFGVDSDEISPVVKDCQMSLALDINNGIDVFNPKASAATPVKRVRVEGAVEKEFAVADSQQIPYQSLSQGLLAMLTRGGSALGLPISMG